MSTQLLTAGRPSTTQWARFPVVSTLLLALLLVSAYGLHLVIQQAPAAVAVFPWLNIWLEVANISFVGLVLLSYQLPLGERYRDEIAAGLLGLFLTSITMLILKGTPYTVGGLRGDELLYTTYVTKFAAHKNYVDVVYPNLPAFYPPLFYYLLGRAADFLNIEPFWIMKPGLLVTTLLLPPLLIWFWRRVVDPRMAVAGAFVLLVDQQWHKPAEWLTLVIFIPWWLHWVENINGRRFTTWRARLFWFVSGGLIGGLIFQTYYYWFFLGGVSLLLHLLLQWITNFNLKEEKHLFPNAIGMLTSAALFSANYWVPYLISMARSGGWEVLQNRWLAQGKIELPLPFLENSFGGLILAGGLGYLVLNAGKDRVARGLLLLLLGAYGWITLGYLGILADWPLLTFRAFPFIDNILLAAAGLGLLQLWRMTPQPTRFPQPTAFLAPLWPALLVICLLFYGQEVTHKFLKNEEMPKAYAATYPQAQLTALDSLIAPNTSDQTLLLTREYLYLAAHRPYFLFAPWSAQYSHPAGLFYQRLDFLERLSVTNTPALFAMAVAQNRYSPIDHLLLLLGDNVWQFSYLEDGFPNRTFRRVLGFAAPNLAEPYFRADPVADLTLFTPQTSAIPLLNASQVDAAAAPLEQVILLYQLAGTFGPHLAAPIPAVWQTVAAQRLQAADLTALSAATLVDLHLAASKPLRTRVRENLTAKLTYPLDLVLQDQQGVASVRFIGFDLERDDPAANTTLALYYEIMAPLDRDYTFWLHADKDGQQHNLDFAPNLPASAWDIGAIYRTARRLALAPGAYQLSVGLWESEDGVRLLQADGAVGVDLGVYELP